MSIFTMLSTVKITFQFFTKGVQLIGINSCLIKNDAPQQKHQLQWLHKELKQKCKIEQRIIFGHHPFFLSTYPRRKAIRICL